MSLRVEMVGATRAARVPSVPKTGVQKLLYHAPYWNRISIMPFVTKVSCTLGGHIHSVGGIRPLCRIGTSRASFLANCRRNTPRIAPRKGMRPIRLGTFYRKSSKSSDWDLREPQVGLPNSPGQAPRDFPRLFNSWAFIFIPFIVRRFYFGCAPSHSAWLSLVYLTPLWQT